ncbi:cupredoxin domain-containing protein [Nonlabens sp.]|uniref:cupredoxin domain-containing protein n=1 Tax=Nonlabens sp. TaxID=1888209 RepID=UPI003F69BBB5
MKKLIALVVIALGMSITTQAQDKMMDKSVKTISLEQVKGEFVQKQVTVNAGTYQFAIANNAVGHEVGFVLVKKGNDISKPENHIKTAYVTKTVATGSTETSKATPLTPGEYVYFCPMNPTSTDNLLIVK